MDDHSSSGFTIIEISIVLAIAGLILMVVFLAFPAVNRSARNTERKHDIALITAALIDYYNNNGSMPGPYTGGVCFEYSQIPPPGYCAQGVTNFFMSLLPELSYYRNIDQFFYATDYGQAFSTFCNHNSACSNGYRNLSSLVTPDQVFIDSSSICEGNTQETWTAENQKNEIIAYALENGSGTPQYQCINILGQGTPVSG